MGQCDVERAPGEPCDSSIYCTSGACLAEGTAGMRVRAPMAKVGDVCGLDEPFCEPSLTCVFGSGTVSSASTRRRWRAPYRNQRQPLFPLRRLRDV
jgi:hypothetical protein